MKNSDFKIVVLISCMHENDCQILTRSNIQTDAIVINQCDKDSFNEIEYTDTKNNIRAVKYICTTQRGLSKSRNLALRYADEYDLCIICDDDEIMSDGYGEVVKAAYKKYPLADIICFSIKCKQYSRDYPNKEMKLVFLDILKTSSQQITFKYKSLKDNDILFDEKMGSGTGNGPGEETKMLLTCLRKKCVMMYHPYCIATIIKGESQWFKGYTEKYFENQGWTDRRLLGDILGFIYIIYWAIFRRKEYKSDGIGVLKALYHSFIGYYSKR